MEKRELCVRHPFLLLFNLDLTIMTTTDGGICLASSITRMWTQERIFNHQGDGPRKAKTLRQSWNNQAGNEAARAASVSEYYPLFRDTSLRYGIGPTPVHKFSSLRYGYSILVRFLFPSGSVVALALLFSAL